MNTRFFSDVMFFRRGRSENKFTGRAVCKARESTLIMITSGEFVAERLSSVPSTVSCLCV